MKLDVGYKSEVDLTADEEAIRFFKPSKVRIASALSRKPSHEIYKDAMIPVQQRLEEESQSRMVHKEYNTVDHC